jgi:hypothetical protein
MIHKETTKKTKDRATSTPLKTGGELTCSGKANSPCFTIAFSSFVSISTWFGHRLY